MGQINGSDNVERRKERVFEIAFKQLDERMDRLVAEVAEAFGREEVKRSFEEISEIRKELMMLDVRVDMVDRAVARLEHERIERAAKEIKAPKEPPFHIEIHKSEKFQASLGGFQLRPDLLEKALKGGALINTEIGEIGEAIGSQSLKKASEQAFVADKDIIEYLAEREINPADAEMRAFPLKTVGGHGPDFYFADRKTDLPIGIVDIKSTTKLGGLNSIFNKSIKDVIGHLDKDGLIRWGDHYQLELSDIRYGLAVGVHFKPDRLDDPDYEITYRIAVVKKVQQTMEK